MIGQLTNHLWQSTAFGLAVAVLAFFFRKSGAHVRYGLWFSASIKFFLPFAFLIALGRQLEWSSSRYPAIASSTNSSRERPVSVANLSSLACVSGLKWTSIRPA